MELTYEEQLKLENSKEHLKVVLSNVAIASNRLEKLYSQIEEAESKLKDTLSKNDSIIKKNIEILTGLEILKSSFDKREAIIIAKEGRLISEDRQREEKIVKQNSEIDRLTNQIAILTSKNDSIVNMYSGMILDLKQQLNTLKNNIVENEKINQEKLIIKKELENEIIGLRVEIEEAKKEFEKFKVNAKSELASIIIEQEQEKEKIKNPLELIKREQDKLDSKERALNIIKARLTKQFRLQNPDVILPIDLQENNE